MAANSIHCCLNVSPPNPTSSPSLPKPALSPWPATAAAARKEAGWKNRCVSTVACVILGSAVALADAHPGAGSFAYAQGAPEAAAVAVAVAARGARAVRWSDLRECPPWRANSLENIMPENLPRPSARRRWENVRISSSAPAVAGGTIGVGREGCFSL